MFSCKFLRTPFFTKHLRWLLLYSINLIEAHQNTLIFVSCFLNFDRQDTPTLVFPCEFCEHLLNLQRFTVHNRKLSQEMGFILHVYYRDSVHGALRNGQLMSSFVEHFNGKPWKNKLSFCPADITKFDKKRYCTLSFCYTALCARRSMKKASDSFFRSSALKNIMKTQFARIFIF